MDQVIKSKRIPNAIDSYAYFFFLLFTITKPISSIFYKIPFFLDIYTIGFGYLFLIFTSISVRRLVIGKTDILIIIYLAYCALSFAWGSEFKEFAKTTISVVFFFFCKSLYF